MPGFHGGGGTQAGPGRMGRSSFCHEDEQIVRTRDILFELRHRVLRGVSRR